MGYTNKTSVAFLQMVQNTFCHIKIITKDMGLGKTIQTIAFICALLGEYAEPAELKWVLSFIQFNNSRFTGTTLSPRKSAIKKFPKPPPILLVVPASLLTNWEQEFMKV